MFNGASDVLPSYDTGNLVVHEISSHNPSITILRDLDVSRNQISTRGLATEFLSSGTGQALRVLNNLDMSLNTLNVASVCSTHICAADPWINFHTDLDVSSNVIRSNEVQTVKQTTEELVVNAGITSHTSAVRVYSDLDVSQHIVSTNTLRTNTIDSSSSDLTILGDVFLTATLNYTSLFGDSIKTKNLDVTEITFPDHSQQSTAHIPYLKQDRQTDLILHPHGSLITLHVDTAVLNRFFTVSYAVILRSTDVDGRSTLFTKVNGVKDSYSISQMACGPGTYTQSMCYTCLITDPCVLLYIEDAVHVELLSVQLQVRH